MKQWWTDKLHLEPVTCQSCGGNANLKRTCCPNERLRRQRERQAKLDAKKDTSEVKSKQVTKPKEEYNARRRERRAAKKPFEECKHCGGNALSFFTCCNKNREERKRASLDKYNEKRLGKNRKAAPIPIAHVCCDCGTPTPDRRCDKCREKWNAKHGVSSSAHSLSADWQGF